jgi:cytochrome c553
MAATLYGVSDADIKALAHYLSRSTPRSRAR